MIQLKSSSNKKIQYNKTMPVEEVFIENTVTTPLKYVVFDLEGVYRRIPITLIILSYPNLEGDFGT